MTEQEKTIHFPALLGMVRRIPYDNKFTSARLRLEFEREGHAVSPAFWSQAIPRLAKLGLIRRSGFFGKSIIPASRGRRLIVWERV
jgi:hypothetical protein